jgi:hypothetical protein
MPIELQFTRDGLGVICQCEGSLGLQHFADANSRLLASPDRIKKLKYVIVDGAFVEPQYFSVTQMEGIILQDGTLPPTLSRDCWLRWSRNKARLWGSLARTP